MTPHLPRAARARAHSFTRVIRRKPKTEADPPRTKRPKHRAEAFNAAFLTAPPMIPAMAASSSD